MLPRQAFYQATFDVYDPQVRRMQVGSIMTRVADIDAETGYVWAWGDVSFVGIATPEDEWSQYRDERWLVTDDCGYQQAHEVAIDDHGEKCVGMAIDRTYSDPLFTLGYCG